jgi:hypothetical protein
VCEAFGIPSRVTAAGVSTFLEEIGAEADRWGDRKLLADDPALPRMLLACYAFLGEVGAGWTGSRSLPFLLARERGPGGSGLRLVAPEAPNAFLSDTPTLEALFAKVGTLFVLEEGTSAVYQRVLDFYASLGVRRLRDAYRVELDESQGTDVTDQQREGVRRLRGQLRALLNVLPRVRAQRRQLDPAGWSYETRLRDLAGSGGLRAIEGLRIRTVLEGVGETSQVVATAYDPRGRLLVDVQVFRQWGARTSALASGVMPCVYDGAGQDVLRDLIEILLPLESEAAMHAYLDGRHFPRARRKLSPLDRLLERLGEILDYGLPDRLAESVSGLGQVDAARWRDPALPERLRAELGDTPSKQLPRAAARLVLDHLGASSREALEQLVALFAAEDLTEAVAGLSPAAPALPLSVETVERVEPAVAKAEKGVASKAAGGQGALEDMAPAAAAPLQAPLATLSLEEPAPEAAAPREEPEPVSTEGPGMWSRFVRWLGLGGPPSSLEHHKGPETGNPLRPTAGIGARPYGQLTELLPVELAFVPADLPSPYHVAIRSWGGAFDPTIQGWRPPAAPLGLLRGASTRRRVLFQGRILPGWNQLPVPLFARPVGEIRLLQGPRGALAQVCRDDFGGLQVEVAAEDMVTVAYEVELLEVPFVGEAEATPEADAALVTPSVPREELPWEVRRWLAAREKEPTRPWERAVAVRSFVERRYAMDWSFHRRPEVRQAHEDWSRGRGNLHLQLLHAAGDGQFLGRGTDYELAALTTDLLRQLGVPALFVEGWQLRGGRADRPWHEQALALLPGQAGLIPFPVDPCGLAARDDLFPHERVAAPVVHSLEPGQRCPFCHEGLTPEDVLASCGACRTVVHGACRDEFGHCPTLGCSGSFLKVQQTLAPRPAVPAVDGPWSARALANVEGEGSLLRTQLDTLRREEAARAQEESALLLRAVRHAARVLRVAPPATVERALTSDAPSERLALLRQALREVFPEPQLAPLYVDLLRGRYEQVTQVSPALQRLVELGLARVKSVPGYALEPVEPHELTGK